MWFKNIYIFRFLKPITISSTDLHEQLATATFQPCGKMEMESIGWVAPLGRDNESLVYEANNCLLFSARKEEKILPASVVREFVNEKVEDIESQQMRKVRKREKNEIRDEVLQDLTPRAFTHSTYQFAYLDITHGWLLIDTPTDKKAEDFATFLRQTLGSLPVTTPTLQQSPANVMTQWLTDQNSCPSDFEFADSCVLKEEEGATANCQKQDLTAEEIHAHLAAGKLVKRLALEWNERLGVIVDDDLIIRRIQQLDLVQAQINDAEIETPLQQFETDFLIMTAELTALIKRLFIVFGGEDETAYDKMR